MKIITTSDWHLGDIFHGNDRLSEQKHFLSWLKKQIEEQQPDALLIAGDVFDNGNPSAASQSAYYEFLADAGEICPSMHIIITAGNHDSAGRIEAPRALLTRHHVEVRGNIHRTWEKDGDKGIWKTDYDDLIIHINGKDGDEAVILAVPYLRGDIVLDGSYSKGVNKFLRELTAKARKKYPCLPLVMMAHMYAKGADIAPKDASEKIIIGGQEEVNMEGWADHPDYMTCGHIHKRQHIWNTDWARYTGSILPMSFAEINYHHGVDLLNISKDKRPEVSFLEYHPQHQLCILPDDDTEMTPKQLKKLVSERVDDRKDGKLGDDYVYVMLKVKMEKVNNEEIKALESVFENKNALLCKIEKIIPAIATTTISGSEIIHSVDDILKRNPLDSLKETYFIKHQMEMSQHQEQMLRDLINSITSETDDK